MHGRDIRQCELLVTWNDVHPDTKRHHLREPLGQSTTWQQVRLDRFPSVLRAVILVEQCDDKALRSEG